MAMESGIVRFVGGPWHNRHVNVEMRSHLRVLDAPPVAVRPLGAPVDMRRTSETVTYRIQPMRTFFGTVFHEYILDATCEEQDDFFLPQPSWVTDLISRADRDLEDAYWRMVSVGMSLSKNWRAPHAR